MSDLVSRQRAVEKTKARYEGKVCDWKTGVTCVRLARDHLRNMGHKPPTLPRFRSLLGAKKSMARRGWEDVAAMLDSMLPRIPAARLLPGDLVVVPGEGIDAIFVSAGFARFFGWRADLPELVMIELDLDEVLGAWRL